MKNIYTNFIVYQSHKIDGHFIKLQNFESLNDKLIYKKLIINSL